MEDATHDAEGKSPVSRLPITSMVFDAGFSILLVSVCQQFLGDGWTIVGAVFGAVFGPVGTLISWKAGGYARRGPLWPGWSKPLSRNWLVVEAIFGFVWPWLLIESIWHNTIAGLAVGTVFGVGSFFVRLQREELR
jgi:hypothetical protein